MAYITPGNQVGGGFNVFSAAIADQYNSVAYINDVPVLMISNDKALVLGASFNDRFKQISLYGRYMSKWLVQ